MEITRDKIWGQIQKDCAEYDALSEALKDVLLQEVAVIQCTQGPSIHVFGQDLGIKIIQTA